MIKNNLPITVFMAIALTWLTACSTAPTVDPQKQQLAADIYAQLALGYMASGHLELAEQRLHKSQELMPNGTLTLEATRQWQLIKPIPPQPNND